MTGFGLMILPGIYYLVLSLNVDHVQYFIVYSNCVPTIGTGNSDSEAFVGIEFNFPDPNLTLISY